LNEIASIDDERSDAIARLVTRLTLREMGPYGLGRLSKKTINNFVKDRVISNELALYLPNGGERFATSALEEGLGL
jgi:hypothetical protein